MAAVQAIEARRPQRQDTFDLRGEIVTDESSQRAQLDTPTHASDDDHSVLEDDSSNEDRDGEYMDEDDGSSSLSIPNESIDFDLVYSLHNFAATVEGQASVVKGDSLFLMDDSNSYWWLVRVLTTQEVGYIPAENIETPFERLARLNKHRNVDLASATQEELQENVQTSRERMRAVVSTRGAHSPSPGSPPAGHRKSVIFGGGSTIFNYPPAVWGDEDLGDEDWDEEDVDYDEEYDEEMEQEDTVVAGFDVMEPDDGMSWESNAIEEERAHGAVSAPSTIVIPAALSSSTPSDDVPSPLKPTPAQQQVVPSAISTQPSAQSSTQSAQQKGLATTLRQQTSRERLYHDESRAQGSPASPTSPAASGSPASATSTARIIVDPAVAGETRKISATPSIAREAARQSLLAQQNAQYEENMKRAREEAQAAEESSRKKGKIKDSSQPVSSASLGRVASIDSGKTSSMSGTTKLRKGRDSPALDEDGSKKKKGGMFSLFGRRKDKNKDKQADPAEALRNSEDSSRSGSLHGHYASSPPETTGPSAAAGVAGSPQSRTRSSSDARRSNAGSTPTPGQAPSYQANPPVVSQHSLRMQQIDQQQQALYQQYLKSSPASAPEGPSYGLQSAASVMPINNNNLSAGFRSQGGRPGSLILSPTGLDGQGVPELSVIRVFAGPNLHTEATFKTVLLNASTTSSDLIRQAMQRFRLAAGEDEADYYLEIKQVEGQSAVLLPHEKPLGVFEELVEAAQLEVPKVKRSSVGSISSVSSNLSMHPAIKKLSMNDFTDDSAVKFYLNRRSSKDINNEDEDEVSTIRISIDDYEDPSSPISPAKPSLTVTTANGTNVTPERFSSPSARFALQVCILPDDLPDGMIFDPHTEAIVPKSSLRDRSLSNAAASSGVSQTQRRKVLQFPKNTTVAEVIELALERFGIAEGVVDGGDEVEDKLAKRISLARVRYGLAVQIDGHERNLQPSSKVLDAFQRPPVFKFVDRRSGEKRRSVDSAMLLGAGEDVRADDPVFMLRRAVGFRNTGKSKMSAPLDEIALQHLHQRESASESSPVGGGPEDAKPQQQMSRQELIAAQRLASREKQRAILSAQSNSERGVDVLLSGNAMLRSSLHETSDKMRYSYVQDGEIYDISDIVEEEQRGGRSITGQGDKRDWLEGVVARNHEGLGDNLDRVLNRIRGSKPAGKSGAPSFSSGTADSRTSDASANSLGEEGSASTSLGDTMSSPATTPSGAQDAKPTRAASATPTERERAGSKTGSYQTKPSVGSLRSEDSSNEMSSPSTPATTATNHHSSSNTQRRGPLIVKDNFGLSDMMAIIELNAASKRPPPPPPMDHVDEMLFGSQLNVEELHPRVREMFAGTFKQLDDMDRQLDLALAATSNAF